MTGRFGKSVRRFALFGVGLLATTGAVQADNNELDALREQIELQKEQIARQQEHLERLQIAVERQQTTASSADVRSMVGEYLAEEKKKEAAAKPPAEQLFEVGKDTNLKSSWKDGLYFETADKAFSLRVRGRVNADIGWGDADNNLDGFLGRPAGDDGLDDGAYFRRGRLGVDGTIYEVFKYVVEFDFADPGNQASSGGTTGLGVNFREVWMGVEQLPYIGAFKAGHFKEPFSLEELTSSRFITFIERSIIADAFDPAYNWGMQINNTYAEENGTWAVGFFVPNNDRGGTTNGQDDVWAVTGRLTYLPWYENDGRCLLHLGVAASFREMDDDNVVGDAAAARFRTRPYRVPTGDEGSASSQVATFLSTDEIPNVDSISLLGLEAALVWGPFSAQAEYIHAHSDRSAGSSDLDYHGWYAYVSYFLTGENRVYRRATGAFDRVRPIENFWWVKTGDDCERSYCCGKGAWELVARYAFLDLRDSGYIEPASDTDGGTGELSQWTFGVNWYWNPNMKVMFNYELFHRDSDTAGRDGNIRTGVVRFAWDF